MLVLLVAYMITQGNFSKFQTLLQEIATSETVKDSYKVNKVKHRFARDIFRCARVNLRLTRVVFKLARVIFRFARVIVIFISVIGLNLLVRNPARNKISFSGTKLRNKIL